MKKVKKIFANIKKNTYQGGIDLVLKKVYLKLPKWIKIILFVSSLVLIFEVIIRCIVWLDCLQDFFQPCWMDNKLIEDMFQNSMTMTTILAAVIVFFYSVQDNCKVGIPYRTIMSYTFGSFTVPVMFIYSMVLLAIDFFMMDRSWRFVSFSGMIIGYVYELIIVIMIILASSYRYILHAIREVEQRQYDLLKQQKYGSDERQYSQLYLLRHMEVAIRADDAPSDKMRLFRTLLRIPYYGTPEKGLVKIVNICKNESEICAMDEKVFNKNQIADLYYYYYGNLKLVFEYLKKSSDSSQLDNVYLVIYEFIDEFCSLYEKVRERISDSEEQVEDCQKIFIITINSIMTAALAVHVSKSEHFCQHIFNHCLKSFRKKYAEELNYLLTLYIIYHEFINVIEDKRDMGEDQGNTEPKSSPELKKIVKHLSAINTFDSWKYDNAGSDFYLNVWCIWSEWTTLSKRDSYVAINDIFNIITKKQLGVDKQRFIRLTAVLQIFGKKQRKKSDC